MQQKAAPADDYHHCLQNERENCLTILQINDAGFSEAGYDLLSFNNIYFPALYHNSIICGCHFTTIQVYSGFDGLVSSSEMTIKALSDIESLLANWTEIILR